MHHPHSNGSIKKVVTSTRTLEVIEPSVCLEPPYPGRYGKAGTCQNISVLGDFHMPIYEVDRFTRPKWGVRYVVGSTTDARGAPSEGEVAAILDLFMGEVSSISALFEVVVKAMIS